MIVDDAWNRYSVGMTGKFKVGCAKVKWCSVGVTDFVHLFEWCFEL